jgi:predicted phosphodiesterase
MRCALVSDIHGNAIALEVVLAHVATQEVDQVICLGDVAALGPEPVRCLDLVRDHATITIMGNTDAWLLVSGSGEPPGGSDNPLLNQMTAWTRDQMPAACVRQVESFPITAHVSLTPSTEIHAFHGSPQSFDDVISATTSDDQLETLLGATSAAIHAGGHTHIQLLRRFLGGSYINPGSVGLPGVGPGGPGLPVNADVYWAEYAIVTSDAGSVSFTFHRLPVSVRQMIHAARSSGMPGYDWWVSKWR